MKKILNRLKLARRLKALARRLADSSLPEALFIATFILIRWWNNSDFSYFSEIFLPIVILGLFASLAFYLYRWIFGPGLAAHLSALVVSYIFYSYQFIESTKIAKLIYGIWPDSLMTPFTRSVWLSLVLGSITGLAVWSAKAAVKRVKFLRQMQFYKVLLFTIAFIFAWQLVRSVDRLWEMRSELAYEYPSPSLKLNAIEPKKTPDIYYLVFDRYTSPEILKTNFSFDNAEIIDFLSQQGFYSRESAYSNYPFTMSSISSTMAMDYFPELADKFAGRGQWQSAQPYRSILKNPPIAQILAQKGYRYNQLSSWWDFTRVGIAADTELSKSYRITAAGKHFYLSDLQRDIIFKSIASPWLKKGLSIGDTRLLKYELDRNPRENFEAQFDGLKKIVEQSKHSQPQFTFAHILAPHPPYVYAADGSEPPYDVESNDNGVDEKNKYLNELIYVNKRLKELISYIRQNSPESVIVLQADEGPYPKQFRGPLSQDHYYDPLSLPQPELRQKFGILASYYLPGVDKTEADKLNSSANAFRFILNKYFEQELPLLPDCHFSAGNKFNLYEYELVNERLGVQVDEQCPIQ